MKRIPGYSHYFATTEGDVWSDVTGTLRKLKPVSVTGYLYVSLGAKNRHSVHSLILLTFIGPRPAGYDCCHNNGNKKDNRLVNLRYDSKSNNQKDRIKHGTAGSSRRLWPQASQHVRSLYKIGITQAEIALRMDTSQATVWRIISNTAYNFPCKYDKLPEELKELIDRLWP